jgi:hypothetical protein
MTKAMTAKQKQAIKELKQQAESYRGLDYPCKETLSYLKLQKQLLNKKYQVKINLNLSHSN